MIITDKFLLFAKLFRWLGVKRIKLVAELRHSATVVVHLWSFVTTHPSKTLKLLSKKKLINIFQLITIVSYI